MKVEDVSAREAGRSTKVGAVRLKPTLRLRAKPPEHCRTRGFRRRRKVGFSRTAPTLVERPDRAAILAQVLVLALFCCLAVQLRPARAQLATSFYTITGIETRRLPNAVQLIIRTDGAVIFGGDLSEWIDFSNNGFEPKSTTQFRLRLVRARARVPAFNNIGAYPLDSAQVTLGRGDLENPYFVEGGDQPEPRVDIFLRFYVPVKVYRFQPQRINGQPREIRFGSSFDPLDVEVRLGDDRRSIVVTVISDRLDALAERSIQRVKPEDQKTQLSVAATADGLSVSALHAPLPDLLARLAETSGVPIVSRASVETERINLRLSAPLDAILQLLSRGLGLVVTRRATELGGGFEVGRDESLESRRIPLQNLSPERARLLLPDWLLPFLRADVENNALIASASPYVLDKIQRDLQVLDRRRARVRVQAEVYEVSLRDSEAISLSLAFGQRGLPRIGNAANPNYIPPAFEFDGRGVAVVRLEDGGENQRSSWRAQLEALRQRGRVRLRAKPFVLVLSGETGNLFLGQSRFIPVLRSRNGQQDVQALNVPVGYSLEARPRVAFDESRPNQAPDIQIDISPRASTVDEIEGGTGLPTLGIREVSTNVRLRAGDAILVAGLDVNNVFSTRSRRFLARRGNSEATRLLVIVTAQIV